MALESLSYQPEIAEMLSKNYRGEHRFRTGLWKCSGAALFGDWGTVMASEACSRRGWQVSALLPDACGLQDLSDVTVRMGVASLGL